MKSDLATVADDSSSADHAALPPLALQRWQERCKEGISEDQKRLFDALHTMREAAWRSFDRRRSFEWKLSFAVWSAMGAYIAALLKLRPATGDPALNAASVVVTLSVLGVHAYWTWGLGRANKIDQDIAFRYYDVRGREVLGLSEDQLKELLGSRAERVGALTGSPLQWSHLSQLLVTFILGLTAVLITNRFG